MKNHSVRTAILGVAVLGASSLFAAQAGASSTSHTSSTAASGYAALVDSVSPTTDRIIGNYSSRAMSVELVLAPRNAAGLQDLLKSVYTPKSAGYGKWSKSGQFDSDFAPTRAQTEAVTRYLTSKGLVIQKSASPFLVDATGSSTRIAAAFRTNLRNFRDTHGVTYFSNSTAVELPRTFASEVLGVVGLTNSVRAHDQVQHLPSPTRGEKASSSPHASQSSCETPYVTAQQLYNAVNNGVNFPYGYGGGPGCSGLTPSQTNSIYGAPLRISSDQGCGSEHRGVRAFRIPALGHRHLGTPVLRA